MIFIPRCCEQVGHEGRQAEVSAHRASPAQGLAAGWSQEWRVLRFVPDNGTSNLIQAGYGGM